MRCQRCNGDTQVIRTINKKHFILRYRKCKKCGLIKRTKEMYDSGWDYKNVIKEIKKIVDEVHINER